MDFASSPRLIFGLDLGFKWFFGFGLQLIFRIRACSSEFAPDVVHSFSTLAQIEFTNFFLENLRIFNYRYLIEVSRDYRNFFHVAIVEWTATNIRFMEQWVLRKF